MTRGEAEEKCCDGVGCRLSLPWRLWRRRKGIQFSANCQRCTAGEVSILRMAKGGFSKSLIAGTK